MVDANVADLDHEEIEADEPSLRDIIENAARSQREPKEEAAPDGGEPVKERARDDRGRFAAKAGDEEADEPPAKSEEKALQKPEQAEEKRAEPPEAIPAEKVEVLRPPPGWSPQSKVDFEKLPEHIKADIAKRETEVSNGFAKLADYKGLDEYVEFARQHGTTLPAALKNYVGIEQQLMRDFPAGIDRLCQNARVDPVALAHHILSRHGDQSNQETGGGVHALAYQQPRMDESAIRQQIADETRRAFEQMDSSRAYQAAKADHARYPFFDNVEDLMTKLVAGGIVPRGATHAETIDAAYQAAVLHNPETRALINQRQQIPASTVAKQAAAVQARQVAKAVIGAPSPGSTPGTTPVNPNASLRETIAAAVNAQRGLV